MQLVMELDDILVEIFLDSFFGLWFKFGQFLEIDFNGFKSGFIP